MSINSKILQAVSKAWNMAFRWIYGLRKFDSTRLLLKSCKTMSAKYLLHRNLLLFFHNVSISRLPLLKCLWCWYKWQNSYRNLLNVYNLINIDNRKDIVNAVRSCFDMYCCELENGIV